jgi:signal transduction histidine kinase
VQGLIRGIRKLDPRLGDGLLALGIGLIFVVEAIAFGDWSRPLIVLELALGLAAIATLIVRRSSPLVPVAAIPALFLIAGSLDSEFFDRLASPFAALLIALYSLGRYERGRRALAGLAWALLAISAYTLFLDTFATSPGQLIWLVVLGAGPFGTGRALADRTRLRAELLARTEELEHDREALAVSAVGAERARIAGELQAVIANGVSAMVLGAEAVPRVIAAGQTDRAARTLEVIEETGRDSLAEMRRLLGVLRRDDEDPSRAPLPTMADVERLLEREREDGLGVEFRFEGERTHLPPGADLAAYRVLQEALDAAAAAGASRALVTVGFGAEELRLDVRDDRAGRNVEPGPLMTMRERLGLYGGRVRAGAGENGAGFTVVARLPLSGVAS